MVFSPWSLVPGREKCIMVNGQWVMDNGQLAGMRMNLCPFEPLLVRMRNMLRRQRAGNPDIGIPLGNLRV